LYSIDDRVQKMGAPGPRVPENRSSFFGVAVPRIWGPGGASRRNGTSRVMAIRALTSCLRILRDAVFFALKQLACGYYHLAGDQGPGEERHIFAKVVIG
jgi:hypothetical protein